MAWIRLQEGQIEQALTTANQLLKAMEHYATKTQQHTDAGNPFPSSYTAGIAQLGEALNAVNAMIKTYNGTTIDSPL